MSEPIIDDGTSLRDLLIPVIDGEIKGRGLVPRDYAIDPVEMFEQPSLLSLIPRSEWSDRIKEMERTESRVSDVLRRANVPILDQGSYGYCWSHSTVGCVQAIRALNNDPVVPLSAFCVAATIKRGRNEGGWCGLSAKFLRENGVCSQALWPQGDANYRRWYNNAVVENAAAHKVTEEWVDLRREVWDQNLAFDVVATCLLSRIPCALDFNWWAHSVMGCDLVEVERGSFGIRIRNSWRGWGENGFGILRGNRAIPDGALAIRVVGGGPI